MQPCSFLHKVSSRVSCSMGLAVGYGRGYSSSADPMSVDLAVELGEGQSSFFCTSFLFLFAASVAFFGTRCEDRAAVDK